MDILNKLSKSKFRSRFKLREKELEYIKEERMDKIHSHACDFIRNRIAPAYIPNDGKQTPMRGHILFRVFLLRTNIFMQRKNILCQC